MAVEEETSAGEKAVEYEAEAVEEVAAVAALELALVGKVHGVAMVSKSCRRKRQRWWMRRRR